MSRARLFIIRRLIITFTLIFAGVIMSEGQTTVTDAQGCLADLARKPSAAATAGAQSARLSPVVSDLDRKTIAKNERTTGKTLGFDRLEVANCQFAALPEGIAPSSLAAEESNAAGDLMPSAAGASIGGRVTGLKGESLRYASLALTGGNLTAPLYARTNSFGKFTFEDLEPGKVYVISVSHRKYGFAQSSQVFTLTANAGDIVFQASWEQ